MLIRIVFVLFLKMEEGFSMAVEDLSKELSFIVEEFDFDFSCSE